MSKIVELSEGFGVQEDHRGWHLVYSSGGDQAVLIPILGVGDAKEAAEGAARYLRIVVEEIEAAAQRMTTVQEEGEDE